MRIGIVNDVAAAAEGLRRAVVLQPGYQVIWTATSGLEAVERCSRETPDLILMDMIMPGIDGAETTRRIMTRTPCAILIVTTSVRANAGRVFEAMGHGALDAVDTPMLGRGDMREAAAPLLARIATISRLAGHRPDADCSSQSMRPSVAARHNALVAIGASAGGPAVLATVLQDLPLDFPAAIVIVQHVDERFASGMAEWLSQHSACPVQVAREGDRPTPGRILLAGSRDHLAMKSADRVGYGVEPAEYAYRPSVDVFFHSVNRFWQGRVVGVLLTGMGRDGAIGLKALRDRGHYTIAQDQASSVVYGMPKAAALLNAAVDVLSAERIAPKLAEVLKCRT